MLKRLLLAACLVALAHGAIAATTGFCAHSSANQRGIPSDAYTQVQFNALTYDTTGTYYAAGSIWTPVPAGRTARIIHISGQVWIVGGAGFLSNPGNPQFVAKVVKESGGKVYDVFAGIGTSETSLQGTSVVQFNGDDYAQPGYAYYVIVYATAATSTPPFPANTLGTIDLDDNPAHLFWCGEILP